MSACRADPRRWPLALAAAAGLLLGAAWDTAQAARLAQATTAPLQLFPEAPRTPEDRPKGPGAVEVDRLGGGVDSLGVLGPAEGGFGPDLWRGSDRASVEHLLQQLPSSLDSPVLMDLARRLLLSNAAPPAGEGMGLLALRAERLLSLGDPGSARRLIAAAPAGEAAEAELPRLEAEAALAAGDHRAACAGVSAGLDRQPDAPFWRKLALFCEISAGNDGQAMVLFDLLRESSSEEEGSTLALAAAALGLGPVPELTGATPLEMALLAEAGAPPPAAVLEGDNAADLALVARQAGFAPPARLAAAERAAEAGTLSAEELRAAYANIAFEQPQIVEAEGAAASLAGPEGRALLLAVLDGAQPAARPQFLQQLLATARSDGLELALSRLLADELAQVTPAAELGWFAETAGRALYIAGRNEAAAAWLALAERAAANDPEARLAALRLQPYARLRGGGPEVAGGDEPASWAEAAREKDPDAVADQTLQLGALYRGLGLKEAAGGAPEWSRLVGSTFAPEPLPDAPALFALTDVAAEGRLGESLLLVLRLVGEEGPGETHLVVLVAALKALMGLGLTADARSLACEAAALRGL